MSSINDEYQKIQVFNLGYLHWYLSIRSQLLIVFANSSFIIYSSSFGDHIIMYKKSIKYVFLKKIIP